MSDHFSALNPTAAGHWLSPAGIAMAFVSFLGALPIIVGTMAGFAAFCFYTVQIFEQPNVKLWVAGSRERRRARKVAKLQYRQSVLTNELSRLGGAAHVETTVADGKSTTNTVVVDPKSSPAGR